MKLSIRQLTMIALMAALICVLGPFSIPLPFSPVPISFCNLAVYIAVFLLGMKEGTVSVIIYVLLGLAGLPVFSGFSGGIGKVLGPTGGYIIGYIFLAIIGGFFVDRFYSKKKLGLVLIFVGFVLGTICLYAFGTAWLAKGASLSFSAALMAGVIPYIPGDIIKILIAIFLGKTLKERLIAANLL